MTCQSCVNKISNALDGVDGITNVDINLDKQTVLVDTSLPSTVVKSHIESTGLIAVLKGYGLQSGVYLMNIWVYPEKIFLLIVDCHCNYLSQYFKFLI